jgi:hypothetical protein
MARVGRGVAITAQRQLSFGGERGANPSAGAPWLRCPNHVMYNARECGYVPRIRPGADRKQMVARVDGPIDCIAGPQLARRSAVSIRRRSVGWMTGSRRRSDGGHQSVVRHATCVTRLLSGAPSGRGVATFAAQLRNRPGSARFPPQPRQSSQCPSSFPIPKPHPSHKYGSMGIFQA